MSLFIGNIGDGQDATEFEELFSNIGSCQVRLKVIDHCSFNIIYRELSALWTSTRRNMQRRPFRTLMVMSSLAGRSVLDGPRSQAETAAVAVAETVAARTASTAASQVTCLVTARSQRNPASQAVVVAVVAAATASTVDSLDTCLASARNPRNPESLVVAAAVAAVAVTASTVDSLVTCHVSVTSPGSLENPKDLAADLEEDLDLSTLLQRLGTKLCCVTSPTSHYVYVVST